MNPNPTTREAATNGCVSIVIVSHNSGPLLLKTLASISASLGEMDTEVIVVDNSSTDGCFEEAQRVYPSCRYVKLAVNVGFSAANNVGVRERRLLSSLR